MYLTRWGTAGAKVVLVHGSIQGSSIGGDKHFSRQQELVESGWQIVVPDRPGHGRSPNPGRPDDPELDGQLVAALLEGGAHLAGHSFGGAVALAAAAQRPSAVRSLTLIEPALQTIAVDDAHVRKFVLSLLMARFFSLSPEGRARRFSKLANIPPEVRGEVNVEEARAVGRNINRLKVASRASVIEQLNIVRRFKIPLLVITGGWNKGIDVTAARAAALGDGRHIIVRSPHHFPNLASNEFNTIFADFMRKAELGNAQ
jgi:pimeloyl-ACP methyl ester carboxylesterase